MKINGIAWMGSSTADFAATAEFFTEVLELEVVDADEGRVWMKAANGDDIEVFGPRHEYFELHSSAGGLTVSLGVDDVESARRQLLRAGIEVIGDVETRSGYSWFHFKGPDGHLYQMTQRP